MKTLNEIRTFVEDESRSYPWKVELDQYSGSIAKKAREGSYDLLPIEKLIKWVKKLEGILSKMGLDLTTLEAGHGLGHILRDFVSSLILHGSEKMTQTEQLAAVIAGTFHDVGCALIDRYDEANRAIRHAEASAILMQEVMESAGLPHEVIDLTCLAIAAHTHYRSTQEVLCRDGQTRNIVPFASEYEDSPIWAVWLARMADRLDCNGPTFVARHFLTLSHDHTDYSADGGFYDVKFEHHMRPLLRPVDERGKDRTMLEHLDMFRSSQNSESPYGNMIRLLW